MKSADTAANLDESKFQEMNTQNEKHQEMLKAAHEKIDELEQRDRQKEQQSQYKDKVIDHKDAEINKVNERNEYLMK